MKLTVFIFFFNVAVIFAQDSIISKNAIYRDTFIGKVQQRNLNCFLEIERANSDFINEDLTYYYSVGGGSTSRSSKIFEEIIKKYNLKFELSLPSCLSLIIKTDSLIPEEYCYKRTMRLLVNNKFSKVFFII